MAGVQIIADRIIGMIQSDAENGVYPRSVRSFAKLHEYTDANMYFEHAGHKFDGSDRAVAEVNAVTDLIDQ